MTSYLKCNKMEYDSMYFCVLNSVTVKLWQLVRVPESKKIGSFTSVLLEEMVYPFGYQWGGVEPTPPQRFFLHNS